MATPSSSSGVALPPLPKSMQEMPVSAVFPFRFGSFEKPYIYALSDEKSHPSVSSKNNTQSKKPSKSKAPVLSFAEVLANGSSSSSDSHSIFRPPITANDSNVSVLSSSRYLPQQIFSGSDKERRIGPDSMIRPMGMRNPSGQCFMNAILQSLSCCHQFLNYLFSLDPKSSESKHCHLLNEILYYCSQMNIVPIPESSSTTSAASPTTPTQSTESSPKTPSASDTFDTSQQQHNLSKTKRIPRTPIRSPIAVESYNPLLFDNIELLFRKAEGIEAHRAGQQDAGEFLEWMLSTMDEEIAFAQEGDSELDFEESKEGKEEDDGDWAVVVAGGGLYSTSGRKSGVERRSHASSQRRMRKATTLAQLSSPIGTMFGGQLRSNIVRQNGERSSTIQPFFLLHLDVDNPQVRTVDDALTLFMSSELLEDGKTTKQFTIETVPDILVVCLKRSFWGAGGTTGQKISKFVRYSDILTLKGHLFSTPLRSNAYPRFALFAVVPHHSQSLGIERGHYTCTARPSSVAVESSPKTDELLSNSMNSMNESAFTADDLWVHYNDTVLKASNSQGALTQQADELLWNQLAINDGVMLSRCSRGNMKESFRKAVCEANLSVCGCSVDKTNIATVPSIVAEVEHINFCRVTCGYEHTLLLCFDGSVWGMGNNAHGELGLSDTSRRTSPCEIVNIPKRVARFAAGGRHSLFVSSDGFLFGTGSNKAGQIGISKQSGCIYSPVRIPYFTKERPVRLVAAGGDFSITTSPLGPAVYAWGANSTGQLGLGNQVPFSSPQRVHHLDGVKIRSIVASIDFVLCVTETHKLFGWGSNLHNQLGISGSESYILAPTFVSAFRGISVLNAGGGAKHSLIVTDLGLFAMGDNSEGACGLGHKPPRVVLPKSVPSLDDGCVVSAFMTFSRDSSFVLTKDRRLFSFGKNSSGNLCIGSTTDRNRPCLVECSRHRDVVSLGAGQRGFTALLSKKSQIIHKSAEGNARVD